MEDNFEFILGISSQNTRTGLWKRVKEKDGTIALEAIEPSQVDLPIPVLKELSLEGNFCGELFNLSGRQVPCWLKAISDEHPIMSIPYYRNDIAKQVGYYPNTVYLHSVSACIHKEEIYYACNYEIPRTHLDDHYSEILRANRKGIPRRIAERNNIVYFLFGYAGVLYEFDGQNLKKIVV